MEFELNLSLKELKKRTSKKYFSQIKLLKEDSSAFQKLSASDKLVLKYLVEAAEYFETINLKLENHKNIEFLEYLNSQIELDNEKARLTKILFDAQKSIFSPDALGNRIVLAKGVEDSIGKGFYPEDLTVQEFHNILNDMLDAGQISEVRNIASQRTVVVRDGQRLKAIDYVDYFPEFKNVAKCLENAKIHCENEQFCAFLEAQIKALTIPDPELDAAADKIWARLEEDCLFEFTITRESYEEQMTTSILDNPKLLKRFKDNGIEILTKDSLGCRVGIVNKHGTKFLRRLKNLSSIAAKYMPLQEHYNSKTGEKTIPQTAVDVDIISLTGEEGVYRAGIVLAQNLPNDDKLSLKIGGGRRNVYHRQIRQKTNKKLYKNLISDDQYHYFCANADHWGTICHENTHSLGPDSGSTLGKYSSILEEFKADMGMYAFLNEFVAEKLFTPHQAKQIIVTNLAGSFLKAMPKLEQAHRTRSCMIVNRMMTEKAITLNSENKLVFDFEKAIETSKKMMEEVVEIQLSKDVTRAREYIEHWFVWTAEQEIVAEIIKKYSKKLNGYLSSPLKDFLLSCQNQQLIKDENAQK